MKHKVLFVAASALIVLLMSKTVRAWDDDNIDATYSAPVIVTEANWSNVSREVFSVRCFFCHNRSEGRTRGNLGLDTFGEAHSKASRIYEMAIILRKMPPPGAMPLTQAQYNLLKAWLEAGAPM